MFGNGSERWKNGALGGSCCARNHHHFLWQKQSPTNCSQKILYLPSQHGHMEKKPHCLYGPPLYLASSSPTKKLQNQQDKHLIFYGPWQKIQTKDISNKRVKNHKVF